MAQEKNKGGRPEIYTSELALAICERLAKGESLRSICRDVGMPDRTTITDWIIKDKEGFSSQYTRARDVALDLMAEEILEISDTPQIGEKTKIFEDGSKEINEGDMIEHRRLRVDSRKWYLSKLAPKKYGDRISQEITGKDGGPIIIATSLDEKL